MILIKVYFKYELESINYNLKNMENAFGTQMFFSTNPYVSDSNWTIDYAFKLELKDERNDLLLNLMKGDLPNDGDLTERYKSFLLKNNVKENVYLYLWTPYWKVAFFSSNNPGILISVKIKSNEEPPQSVISLYEQSNTLFQDILAKQDHDAIIKNINNIKKSDNPHQIGYSELNFINILSPKLEVIIFKRKMLFFI